ncbi:hypothetical protein MGA5115_01509 [Marinomonas gallaica]|uniref:Uncharacterized protein n=1 Tax=Marinomonas gallaica TaxID=1806667 RepID=A0A1C3JQA2_9GAMM|nr:hypothetical protein [Marinomonas gallaica]SBT17398.1 hypothetical protein MGA5115_01509 [Marinomonas gallaica]SBT19590.1 hypothetical protein MGA5116_00163 [Marinomonas gallaica]
MDILRTLLIFAHLLVFAFAITNLFQSDIKLLSTRINTSQLKELGRQMKLLLFVLAVTGAGIVYIDTAFSLEAILSSDKLMAKMVCVGVLIVNAFILHNIVFKKMEKSALRNSEMAFMMVSGAISTCSWTFAGFLGIAKALSNYFSFSHFLYLYGSCLLAAIVLAMILLPTVRRNWQIANAHMSQDGRSSDVEASVI